MSGRGRTRRCGAILQPWRGAPEKGLPTEPSLPFLQGHEKDKDRISCQNGSAFSGHTTISRGVHARRFPNKELTSKADAPPPAAAPALTEADISPNNRNLRIPKYKYKMSHAPQKYQRNAFNYQELDTRSCRLTALGAIAATCRAATINSVDKLRSLPHKDCS
ncbi:hypothetical protein EVAR_45733_1 [Eumeta japonica]|uniref:Uncharacterized protein n=1 Tax=Eumeta variegata TaxID=151549 RepID=A0A4C1WX07_EUMVA|nr:hypothetical protein EVAR_45733_1 [Eumeta japonica]